MSCTNMLISITPPTLGFPISIFFPCLYRQLRQRHIWGGLVHAESSSTGICWGIRKKSSFCSRRNSFWAHPKNLCFSTHLCLHIWKWFCPFCARQPVQSSCVATLVKPETLAGSEWWVDCLEGWRVLDFRLAGKKFTCQTSEYKFSVTLIS